MYASTYTHSAEKEEEVGEEEVPEGSECGVLVWFSFRLLLQYRLFFHWLLSGPAEGSKSNTRSDDIYQNIFFYIQVTSATENQCLLNQQHQFKNSPTLQV